MSNNEFGDRIREARLKANLGLREAARQLGISPSYLSMVETDPGEGHFSDEMLAKVAKLIKVDLAELKRLAGIRRSGQKLDRSGMKEVQAFYRIAQQHNITPQQAVKILSDAVSKQYPKHK
mgnify:CR=1 FL=1